ncbi:TRAP transporter small permease [Microbacterium sp. No. 7]|uniref:TRAP transporter small permease n=1 Tax=Microbacterium sp. No. 7 TaxID=1714373 RepID=UPI0006D1DD8C|nr:TRAP transporter small permease subunit [Microbacterium sp. No. 7]ALJ22100.1 hypothetical protein AOA12_20315 [Microbacterium sp. No. 7]
MSDQRDEEAFAPSTNLVPLPGEERTEVVSLLTDTAADAEAIPEPAPQLRRAVAAFETLTILAILGIFLIQMVQVGGRAISVHVPPWSYELTRLLLVWMVCVGAFVSYYQGTSLSVPGRWRPRTVSYEAAALLTSGALLWAALRFLGVQGWAVAASSLLGLPAAVGYLSVVVFAGGVAVVAVVRIAGIILRKVRR